MAVNKKLVMSPSLHQGCNEKGEKKLHLGVRGGTGGSYRCSGSADVIVLKGSGLARRVPSRPPSKRKLGKGKSRCKNAYAVVDHSLFLDGSAKKKKKRKKI